MNLISVEKNENKGTITTLQTNLVTLKVKFVICFSNKTTQYNYAIKYIYISSKIENKVVRPN